MSHHSTEPGATPRDLGGSPSPPALPLAAGPSRGSARQTGVKGRIRGRGGITTVGRDSKLATQAWSPASTTRPFMRRQTTFKHTRTSFHHAYPMRTLCILLGCATAIGCSFLQTPQTVAEKYSGYTYVPLDPFPILPQSREEAEVLTGFATARGVRPATEVLSLFPDNAARFSIERIDSQGKVTYGTSEVTAKGEVFRVTTDYTSSDTANFPVRIGQYIVERGNDRPGPPARVLRPLSHPLAVGDVVVGYEVDAIDDEYYMLVGTKDEPEAMDLVNIPIYIGIGLRITADLVTLDANAKVDGLGVIGAEAEASRIRGSMVIQTLGINGKSVAAALPIQSELNRTTIYSAASAIGAIKALIHEDETTIYPRIVGLYLPFRADKALVNAIISELSASPPRWYRLSEIADAKRESKSLGSPTTDEVGRDKDSDATGPASHADFQEQPR